MRLGSLIRFFRCGSLGAGYIPDSLGIIGLVIDYDHEAQGTPNIEGRGMVQALFVGSTLPRWVHEQDCEVVR
jgi:hypothetical protein